MLSREYCSDTSVCQRRGAYEHSLKGKTYQSADVTFDQEDRTLDLVLEHEVVDLGDSNGVDEDEDDSIEESRREHYQNTVEA